MNRSLRRRLVTSLLAVVLAAWAATAVFSYVDARRRIGRMLDDHLVQAATLLLTAGAHVPGEATRAPLHWGPAEEGHALVYQAWSEEGALLFRSADAPQEPLSPQAEAFSEVRRNGEPWRVFGMRSPERRMRVLVAEHAEFRGELAASVARNLLYPLAVALPVLAALIWIAVRWGLTPLQRLASEVEQRAPTNLAPLDPTAAPSEARPLVDALDALFVRVAASMQSERRFTADAAHELRTPLAAIQTHAEVALAARDERERAEALRHVTDGTQRATRLIGQLLMLARLDARAAAPALSPVRLVEIASRQVADAAPSASAKGVQLGLSAPEQEVLALADPDLLGVLLRNLVDNAVRYTPSGGSVDVAIRPAADAVAIVVTDTGPGIPAEERPRVLERFYRVRGTREEGSGLGLSIAARIAELHGASLALDDAPGGRGLSVAVTLRRGALAAQSTDGRERELSSAPAGATPRA